MAESLEKIMIQRGHQKGENKNNPSGTHIILHGGEAFSLPIKDFSYFMKLIQEYQFQPAIQTSLFGMTDKHVKILKKYNVSVGISLDGPAELNVLRGPRDPNLNKKYQKDVAKNLEVLQDEKIPCGIVTVVNEANAGDDKKLAKLVEWSRTKTSGGRFNAMFVPWFVKNHPAEKYLLSEEKLKHALYLLDASFKYSDFYPAFVSEMIDNLLGLGLKSCQFGRCDYLTTKCITIMPNGLLARCDRCFQDGYYYISTDLKETQQGLLSLDKQNVEILIPKIKFSRCCR